MDAQTHIPKVSEPLEFEDGPVYLIKTDILRQLMYFSYDKGSLSDLYVLTAEEVKEVIKMNRNGLKPESLKGDGSIEMPEFITAVGEGSISRFDKPSNKKHKHKKNGKKKAAPKTDE